MQSTHVGVVCDRSAFQLTPGLEHFLARNAPVAHVEDMQQPQLGARTGFDDLRAARSAVFRRMDPGGTRMNMLSERAGMTKQSMAYPVEGLREPGYLSVVADPAERRAKLVRLTRRDSKKVETLVALSKQFEDWLAGAMGVANMKRLRTLLEQAAGVLERRGQG